MRKIVFILLAFSPIAANAQFGTDEFCGEISKIESLSNGEVDQLQEELDTYFNQAFGDVPTIAEGFEELPKDWLKQGFLVGLAECYINGNHVEKDIDKAKVHLRKAKSFGNEQAAHMLASLQLFRSADKSEQREGFEFIEQEYMSGSAYSAGKLGWAYQKGLGIEPNHGKALELYNYAAKNGMTYWQYLLAHAYQKGYLGLAKDKEKSDYWLKYEPKVHTGSYACWVTTYYEDGTFPENKDEFEKYKKLCEALTNKASSVGWVEE